MASDQVKLNIHYVPSLFAAAQEKLQKRIDAMSPLEREISDKLMKAEEHVFLGCIECLPDWGCTGRCEPLL